MAVKLNDVNFGFDPTAVKYSICNEWFI